MRKDSTIINDRSLNVYGLQWHIFLICAAVVLCATFLGVLPSGMQGVFPLMIVLGAIFNEIGNNTPIIKSYLGGGAIVTIFGCAALSYYMVLPSEAVTSIITFMKSGGFLDFYISALITGSILGMSRSLLIKSAVRYLPAILGGVVCALGLVGIAGALTGYGAKEAILFIGIPIMGGGMGAGAVPLAEIFSQSLGQSSDSILSVMIPAVALGNAMAIVIGGLLNRLGRAKPKLSGNGQLLTSLEHNLNAHNDAKEHEAIDNDNSYTLEALGVGLLVSTVFMVFANVVYRFIPGVHYYAWMILSVALVKSFGILPQAIEKACFKWFQFVMNNLTGVLLVGIGIAYTDLGQIFSALTPMYILLVLVVILGAVLGSGLVGKLVGFFTIEAAITAGLCMANMGGTGDVAVLSAADRMELMPFAQISSRIGGAFMLVLTTVILKIFI